MLRCTRCVGLASLALLSCVTGTALAEPPVSFWNSGTNYSYGVAGIPDFDQVRAGLTPNPNYPQCTPIHWPLQQNDAMLPGMMHCGPTTGTDLYVFMANHGYPELLPQAQIGVDWTAPANYAQGTAHIGLMGQLMGVNPNAGGCSIQGFVAGLRNAIGNRPLTVRSYQAYGTWSPTLDTLAATGLNNSIMGICYGHYQVVGMVWGNVPVVNRQGGHFVAVSGARRVGNQGWLWVRDPADDCGPGAGPNICNQSAFADGQYRVDGGWVLILQNPFPPQYRWVNRLNVGAPVAPAVGQNIKLVDGAVYVQPRRVIGKGPDGKLKVIRPAQPWTNLTGSLLPPLECDPFPWDHAVLDVDIDPDMTGAVIVAPQQQTDGRNNSGNILKVDATNSQMSVIGNVDGALKIATGSLHDFLILHNGGSSVTLLQEPPAPDDPNPAGELPPAPVTIALPAAVHAIAYDPTHLQWVMVSFTTGQAFTVGQDLQGGISTYSMPRVPTGSSGSIHVMAHKPLAALFAVVNGSPRAWEVVLQGGGTSTVTEHTLTGVAQPSSISFLETTGHMVVTDGSSVVELERVPRSNIWNRTSSPELNLSCPMVELLVDDDVTGFVPGYHDDPAWHDNPDLITPGMPVPDPQCTGDLNGDGIVDAADLGILLGDWGPNPGSNADMNSDGSVDGADLGRLLGRWGPCGVS